MQYDPITIVVQTGSEMKQNRAVLLNGHTTTPSEVSIVQEQKKEEVGTTKGEPPLANTTASNGVVYRVVPTDQIPQMPQTGKRKPDKRVLIIGGVLAALLLGAIGLAVVYVIGSSRDVTAFQVGIQQKVPQFTGGGGIVFPRQQFDLSYPVGERVVSVFVKAGDTVTLNQPLIKLDPAQLNNQIQQASNDLAAAQAYLNSVASVNNPVIVAQAQQALQLAQNRYNALVAQATSSTLRNGNLISPMNGVVTAVNINPGEVFAANTILLTIMDQSTVTIRAKIPLSNLQQVGVGMAAQVTPSALPDLTIAGTVTSIIPQADPQTDTFEVWVEVLNPRQTLLPGMSAFVRIQGQGLAYVVPRLAVLDPDHQSIVFVVNNNHVSLRYVHVAGRSADSVYIDSGLSTNDIIVLIPLDKMHDGQQVNVTRVEHGS